MQRHRSTNEAVRPSIPQGERLWSHPITLIGDGMSLTAAIEETSSSLEQVFALALSNVRNAQKADIVIKDVDQAMINAQRVEKKSPTEEWDPPW